MNTRVGTPFVGHHGSRSTADVLLGMSGPGIQTGRFDPPASLAAIVPTLYRLLGLSVPAHVDGKVLDPILQSP